jgi:hypothetical protein
MNEQDLRDCFAMFAMMGLVTREGVCEGSFLELDAWAMADRMLATRETSKEEPNEDGIVAIKKRVRKK